jgi:hypothetical protein
VKRQRALVLLADPKFVEGLFSLARRWRLDTHLYEEDLFSFWHHECAFGQFCWSQFLLWLSVRHTKQSHEREQAEKRQIAARYAQDLDFAALRQALDAISDRIPMVRFRNEVRALARGHGLSALWDHPVAALLTSGLLFVPYQDCRVVLQKGRFGNRLFLEVFPETTKVDVVDKWGLLSELRERFFPDAPRRQRRRPRIERDLSTLVEREAGRSIESMVVEDYDLDERVDELGSWSAVAREEDALAKRLRKGALRLTKTQAEAMTAAAEPLLPEWVREWDEQSGSIGKEWYF